MKLLVLVAFSLALSAQAEKSGSQDKDKPQVPERALIPSLCSDTGFAVSLKLLLHHAVGQHVSSEHKSGEKQSLLRVATSLRKRLFRNLTVLTVPLVQPKTEILPAFTLNSPVNLENYAYQNCYRIK